MNESVASGQRNATADVLEKLPAQMTRSRNRSKQVNLSDSKLGPQFIAILAQQLQDMLDNSRTKLNDEIAAPPNHQKLFTLTGCRGHEIMTCRSIQRLSCGAHPTPGLGTLVTNVGPWQINGRDGRIYLQRLGQSLEAATDQA